MLTFKLRNNLQYQQRHILILHVYFNFTGVALRLSWGATSPTVPGSIPGGVTGDFFSEKNMCPEVDTTSENEYHGFLLG